MAKFVCILIASTTICYAVPQITSIRDNSAEYPGKQILRYGKYELTFQVTNTVAGNLQLPFDASPPDGIDPSYSKHNGISVDALFLPPGVSDWEQAFSQPGFYYTFYKDEVKQAFPYLSEKWEWYYPTGQFAWKVRFSSNMCYFTGAKEIFDFTIS